MLHEANAYVCEFNLMKSECHQISTVAVPFVKSGRNTQEKDETTTFSCLFFCLKKKKWLRVPHGFRGRLLCDATELTTQQVNID